MSGRYLSFVVAVMMLAGQSVPAQGAGAAGAQALDASGKAMAFEVVSIRPSDPVSARHDRKITPDGYLLVGMPLLWQIMDAYPPQMSSAVAFTLDHVKGYPSWLATEQYDIDARVAAADREGWQKPDVRRTLLRAMFEERCGLKVHREVKEGDVYRLVVGKNGSKLKVTDPDAVTPPGSQLTGGGVLFLIRVPRRCMARRSNRFLL